MDTEAPPVIAPAKKDGFDTGCVPILLILVGIIVIGFVWNAVAGGPSHTKHVTRSDYGTVWPLTVDSATIGCANGSDPYVQVDSIRYGLTGNEYGYSNIGAIWADDPASPGLKVDIAPLRADALKLC